MSAQRYTDPRSHEWMSTNRCPECGERAEHHSGAGQFWLRDPNGCSLLPRGVTERIEQYVADVAAVSS